MHASSFMNEPCTMKARPESTIMPGDDDGACERVSEAVELAATEDLESCEGGALEDNTSTSFEDLLVKNGYESPG